MKESEKRSLPVLSLRYDELYREGQQVLDKYNPCKISADGKKCTGGTPCCTGCEHLGNKGCTVSALHCKLWLCHTAAQKYPDCYQELQTILHKGHEERIPGIWGMRQSKTDAFSNLLLFAFEENSLLRRLDTNF